MARRSSSTEEPQPSLRRDGDEARAAAASLSDVAPREDGPPGVTPREPGSGAIGVAVLRAADLVLESADEAIEGLLGAGPLAGRSAPDALPELALGGVWSRVEQVARTGVALRASDEPLAVRGASDGASETRFVRVSCHPVRDARGTIASVVLIAKDVTREVRLRDEAEARRRELVRSERRHRALVAAVSQIVWATDHLGRVLEDSPSFRAFTGQSPEQLLGELWLEAIHEDDRELVLDAMRRASDARGPYEVEARVRRADGAHRILAMRGVPVRDDDDAEVREWVGTCEDVTDRKRLEAQLMVADRLASVGTMAAGVAHEINNPLSWVLGNIEYAVSTLPEVIERAARSGGDPGERPVALDAQRDVVSALEDAKHGAQRVRDVVRDLETFSRSTDDRVALVDVRRALDATLQLAGNEIRHRARLVKDYGDVPAVSANESRLAQVFLNLVLNAVTAIPEGHADSHVVRVATGTSARGEAWVEVHDTGVGILPEHRNRVFDPFFTTKPVGAGTGLGLAICHGIAVGYGGTIAIESEVGRGTCVRVTLPAAHTEAAPSPSSAAGAAAATPRRVLIVDDEPLVLSTLRRALGRDHDVTCERNGRSALERIARGERFDAILCDLMMPETNGAEVYEEMARIAPGQAARMAFLTGGAFTPAARQFLDGLSQPVLEKPFDLAALRALVARIAASRDGR